MTQKTLAPDRLHAATTDSLDEARVEAFAGRLFEFYTGGMLTFMVDIGHRTGLFAAAAAGPASSAELAGRADLQERYVREWLAAMATGGIVDYEPGSGSFRLPAERAACLTGRGAANPRNSLSSTSTSPSSSCSTMSQTSSRCAGGSDSMRSAISAGCSAFTILCAERSVP